MNRLSRAIPLTCTAWAILQGVTACGHGDPPNNDNLNLPDAAVPSECGDGVLGLDEECDEGEANSDTEADRCRTLCRLPFCGDGVLDTGEACDGSALGGATCVGLGYLSGSLNCTGACELDTGGCQGAACGNGDLEGDEECDDGNTEDGDGCSAACVEESGWNCSEGSCVTVCGDDLLRGDEECDDGSTQGGDGCSADCTIETAWQCSGEPSSCTCAPYYHGADCAECRVHVDADRGAPSPDGLAWASSLATLQEGLTTAAAQPTACEVWVAAGTYRAWNGAQTDTLQLVPEVAVYGGFAGAETSRDGRNWVANPTLLDGREPESTWRRVFHVVTAAEGALLDGFTITNGRADGADLNGRGGGLFVYGASMTVANCLFDHNEAGWGGALYTGPGGAVEVLGSTFEQNQANFGGAVANVEGQVLLSGATLLDNEAGVSGGALYSLRGRLRAEDSDIDSNHSDIDGGGLTGVGATLEVERCTITNNSAYAGGGLLAFDDAFLTVIDTHLEGNQARQGAGIFIDQVTFELRTSQVVQNTCPDPNEARGAGLYATESDVAIRASDFNYNGTGAERTHAGGALYLDACSSAVLSDSGFLSNSSGAGGAIWSRDTALEVSWCLFEDNHASGGAQPNGGAIDVHGGALLLLHSELWRNSAERQGGAVSVSAPSGSVLVGTCLFAENSAAEKASALALAAASSAQVAQSTISSAGVSAVAVESSTLDLVNDIIEGTITSDLPNRVTARNCLVPAALSYCTECVVGSPGFVGGGDYHLTAGSLALSAGDEDYSPSYTDENLDLGGHPWGTLRRDLGCYDYY